VGKAGAGRLDGGRRQRLAVEALHQDRADAVDGAGADHHGARAGSLETGLAVPLAKPQDPQTGAVPVLGMGLLADDRLDELSRAWPDRLGPTDHPRRSPLGVVAMDLGHVLRDGGEPTAGEAARVGSHPATPVEDLDGGGADPDLHTLVHQGEGD
jgi:hypothetical protein